MITTIKTKPNFKKQTPAQEMIDACWHLTLLFGFAICVLMSDDANAAGPNAISTVFCNINGLFMSNTGRAIADVAVIALGVSALMGKVSWGQALTVAVGIGLMFGSGALVAQLGGVDPGCVANPAANQIESVFCNVVGIVNGSWGVALATIAIISLGLAAVVGKVSQGMALMVAAGIGIIFGANALVGALGGGGTCAPAAIGANSVTKALCAIADAATSSTGAAIATVGVIGLGAAGLMGKVSTATAVTVAAGIGVVYGAATLATSLGATGAACVAAGIDVHAQICDIVYIFVGTPGVAVATLAVIAIGIGGLLGKVSSGMVVAVAVGVGVVFGAPSLVNSMGTAGCTVGVADNTATTLNKALCSIVGFFGIGGTTGVVGAALVTLCIIPMGVAALLGKISPGTAVAVATGIGLVFGADTIISSLAVGISCAASGYAADTTANTVSETLCEINAIFSGGIGAAIATLAVVALGVGALMGKISWGQAMAVTSGIGMIFGAANITTALGGGACGVAAGFTAVGAAAGIIKPICYIVSWCTGAGGQTVAAIALIAMGLSSLNGKVSWGTAMILSAGIALVFGASSIVVNLGGTAGVCTPYVSATPVAFISALCGVITAMTGVTGRAIAAVGIAAVGIMAINGKVSSGMALLVATGVALIFGATSIVTNLGGGTGGCATSAIDLSGHQTAIGQAFCNALAVMTGITGKSIAATGVIALGAGALMGKLQHSTASALAVGVAAVFGASSLVVNLGGENAWSCNTGLISGITAASTGTHVR